MSAFSNNNHKSNIGLVSVLTISLFLSSCGSSGPKISSAQINAAEKNGTLTSLYQQIKNQTGVGAGLNTQDRSQLLQDIGRRLATNLVNKSTQKMNAKRLANGLLSLPAIDDAKKAISPAQDYNGAIYASAKQKLDQEAKNSKKAIALAQSQLAEIDITQLKQQFNLIDSIAELKGDQQFANNNKQELLQQNIEAVKQYLQANRIEQAMEQLKTMMAVAPDYQPAQLLLQETEASKLQRGFVESVNAGNIEQAQSLFAQLIESPRFDLLKAFITPSVLELKNYYLALAMTAMEDEDIAQAYENFTKVDYILTKMSLTDDDTKAAEAEFSDMLYQHYQQAIANQNKGLALGYLAVIKELQPQFPELDINWRNTVQAVEDLAVKRLTVSAFNSDPNRASLARTVATNISQSVMEALPNEVRIVERENLQAVLKEQEINALQKGDVITLAAADMLVQGSVLEANVESMQTKGKKKIRATTGHKKVINPEYNSWLMLKSSEQKNTPQPTKYIDKAITEDVSIDITHYRKVAILSLSYRLVDAKSAKVVLTNTFNDKQDVMDDGQEGVELGEFKLPFKMANLPSDSELLRNMANKMTNKITQEIVQYLKDPAKTYQQNAQLFAKQNNFLKASEEQAKALVLLAKKKVDISPISAKLREYTTRAVSITE